MSNELKIGQVLWLKVRYQIDKVSDVKHPMLVADIQDDYIEVIAIDKTDGKLHNLYYPYNKHLNKIPIHYIANNLYKFLNESYQCYM